MQYNFQMPIYKKLIAPGNLLNETAQSLVEVVIAIGLLASVFTSSWQILHTSFMSINQEMIGLKAHYLVVEGLEGIRSIKDEDWNSITDGTWYFRFDESDPENQQLILVEGQQEVLGMFQRRIEVSSVRRDSTTGKITENPIYDFDPNTKLIEVIVEWNYKSSIKTDQESIYLTDWARF